MEANKLNIKITGITYSKHRNAFGLIGINVMPKQKMINVAFARQWDRKQLNEIPDRISALYKKINWNHTYIDQLIGQHFISDLRKIPHMPLSIITTGQNLKDPNDIERVHVMDMIEMVQFLLSVKQNGNIRFTTNPNGDLLELETQIAMFTENKTERGNVSYYSPGDELDSLTKSLLIACFAARKYLKGSTGKHFVSSVDMVSNIDDLGSGLTGSQMLQGKSTDWTARNRREAGRKFMIR